MSFAENDDLKRAIEALTIFDLWERAHRAGVVTEPCPPQRRDGQYPSPFREDGRKGSFSICHAARGYKDFGGAGDRGGVWQFHALCWPQMEKKDRATQLIEWSGITPTPPPTKAKPAAGSSATAAAPAEVDPALAKAAKAIEKKNRLREMEEAVYQAREDALRAPPPKAVPSWAACVKTHYMEGVAHMAETPRRVAELAKDRGWPIAWAQELVDRELVAYPWERWAIPGERWAGRQKAFLVQVPRYAGGGVTLEAIGYHQRFYVPATAKQAEQKGWLYVPSMPKHGARSEFERDLVAYGKAIGLEWDERRGPPALVPPVPFVIGDLATPRLAVLLEGQWDAVTFYGACGFMDETALPPKGLVIFGIRGAQGVDAFLSYWGQWLAKHKPRVWGIADNDAAGGAWRDNPPALPGLPRPPGFAERIRYTIDPTGKAPVPLISWLKRSPWGKDFNDYFKARAAAGKPLGAEQMFKWMGRLGLLDGKGGFA
jgi:hypothetical protein